MPRKLVPERYVIGTFGPPAPAANVVAAWSRLAADDVFRRRCDAPAMLLSEYFRERHRSRVGKLLTTAARFTAAYDPLVFVGRDAAVSAAAAFTAATSHPYYNQLADGGRGGRPRVVFVAPTLDNDRLQAVFDLLKSTDESHLPGHRWGLVVERPPPAMHSAESCADLQSLVELFREALRLDAANESSTNERCLVLNDVSPGYTATVGDDSHLGALTIVAAATVGGDVVGLFKGAAWFHEAAKHAAATEVEAVRLAEYFVDPGTELVVWHHALEPLARRFAAGAPTVVGFDPPVRRKLLCNESRRRVHVFTDVVRRDRLPIAAPSLADAYAEVRAVEATNNIDACEIRLARLNDQALGELCAWFETASLIKHECRMTNV